MFLKELAGKEAMSKIGRVDDDMGEPRFWLFGIIGIGTRRKATIGYDIWQCIRCGQKWKMDEPDNAWRGFFLKIESTRYLDHSGRKCFLDD